MDMPKDSSWQDTNLQLLKWARKLHALAQTGLAYTKDPYDIERYRELQQVAADMMGASSATVPPANLD